MTVSIADARTRARRTVERSIRSWAAQSDPVATLTIALAPPNERAVLADYSGAAAWAATWRGVDGVEWATRRWASVGAQQVPVRLVLGDVQSIVDFAGAGARWRALRSRLERVRGVLTANAREGTSEALDIDGVLTSQGAAIEALDEPDLDRLIGVLGWLEANTTSGRRIRELPIRGVDTKWLGRHRGLVAKLHGTRPAAAPLDFTLNPRMITVRFLDAAFAPSGLRHLALPVADLARLPVRPETVLMCENLETLLALPEMQGTIAVHGAGYGLSSWVGEITWLRAARLVYWGDLDSHGFAILSELRSVLPAESLLMDASTLEELRELWVPEPKPARGHLPRLTPGENAALDRLRAAGDPRLEQERVPWPLVLAAFHDAGLDAGPPLGR